MMQRGALSCSRCSGISAIPVTAVRCTTCKCGVFYEEPSTLPRWTCCDHPDAQVEQRSFDIIGQWSKLVKWLFASPDQIELRRIRTQLFQMHQFSATALLCVQEDASHSSTGCRSSTPSPPPSMVN